MAITDQKTYKELLINNGSTKSLMDIFDETKTIQGRENLSKIFKSPLLNKEEILTFNSILKEIISNFKIWEEFHYILDSKTYTKVLILKQKQLLHSKPLLKRSFIRQNSLIKTFLTDLYKISSTINKANLQTEVIDELINRLNNFNIIIDNNYSSKFINWYCLNLRYKDFNKILESLYLIDTLVSLAKAHITYNLQFPKWNESFSPWIFKDLYNLLIENPITNSIEIPEGTKTIFLTGPNMAGKTTFMISIGQAIYLARCGLGVPASEVRLNWFDNLSTAFESDTSLSDNMSFFGSEVERSAQLLSKAYNSNFSILLIDELFKGTNIKDSNDCFNFYMEHLSQLNSLNIISTHLSESVNLYNDDKFCSFYHFEGSETKGDISFNYKIKQGVSNQRLGLKLLKNRLLSIDNI